MLIRNKKYHVYKNIAQRLLDGHRRFILAITLPSISKYYTRQNKGLTGLPEIYFIRHNFIGSDEVYKIVSPRAFNYLDAIKIPLVRKSRLLEAGFVDSGKTEFEKSMELIDDNFRNKIVLIVVKAPDELLKNIKRFSLRFDVQIKTLKYNLRGAEKNV